ncbi:MAG: ABC transporter substrate-binding protein [Caldisericia bacterium]|nr:ABC transporter substrate-binding protein [Caldisericia bacterium]
MKKLFALLLVAVLLIGVVSACGPADDDVVDDEITTEPETVMGGVFRFPLAQPVPTIDPAQLTDTTSHEVGKQIFEGLVTYDIDLNIIPSLAKSWDISEDGTVYTFHLREVNFNDGTSFTADDVKWSFERVLDPGTKSPRKWILEDISGAKDYTDGIESEVNGIEIIDENTIMITINEISPVFIHKLTYSSAWIVNRDSVEDNGDLWYEENPVGTGPFILSEWMRNQKLVLLPNPDYWGDKAKIDRLEYYVHTEDTIRQQEYEAGNIDYNVIADADFDRIKNDEILFADLQKIEQLGIQYIGFRTNVAPFDNMKFRQAFCYAVDRNRIIDEIYNNRFKLATGIIPSAMPNFPSETDAYPYDPVMAKNLLEEAVAEGLEVPDTITFAYNKGTATHKNVAEFIQNQIQNNLGIELILEEYEWATYLEKIDNGEFPVFRLGWLADYPDPDNFLWVLLDSANAGRNGGASFYSNPDFDALVREAKTLTDNAARMGLYVKAEKIAMDEAVWMPINFQTNWYVLKSNIKGLRITAMGTLPHNYVEIH